MYYLGQLWKLEGETLKNKSGIWMSRDEWNFGPVDSADETVYIENTSKGTVLSISNEEVKEVTHYQNDAAQIWRKGDPDNEGYFTLSSSNSEKVLTAVSDHGLEMKGILHLNL